MRTTKNLLTILAVFACVPLSVCKASDRQLAAGKLDLRILYFGHPDSVREKDFVDFLSRHFKEVRTADLKRFRVKRTRGSDVIILDYDGDGFKARRLRISQTYKRPTVTVGVIGAFICGSLRLKTGYL